MTRRRSSPPLLLPLLIFGTFGCVGSHPAAAQSAAGSAAIQAANDAMNTVISDVAEGTTDAAGVLSGLPVHDAGLGAEIPELNTSINEEIMAAADGIMNAVYNQEGFPEVAPTALSDELSAVQPSSLSSPQAISQIEGQTDSTMGSEISAADKAATEVDQANLTSGYQQALDQRMGDTRQGLEGDAGQDLADADEVDATLTAAKTTANEVKDAASGQQMQIQVGILVAKILNDERKNIDALIAASSLTEQRSEKEAWDRVADIEATKAIMVP